MRMLLKINENAMKTYPNYDEFLSCNLKHLPYKWKQQGNRVDIEIAGMKFEAIFQEHDKLENEDLFRLSVLFGAFANRKPMTRQQLINWLMQCLFKTWCELSSIFDSAAFITWLAQKWVDDDNVLPDNVTVRCDTGVIETGAGVSATVKALKTLSKSHKKAANKDSINRAVFEDTDTNIKKSEVQLKNERVCESIQSLVLQAFGLQKKDLQKDIRQKSNPMYRCKLVIVLLCLNANQTFEMISRYCGCSQSTAYNIVNNLSKYLAMLNETNAKTAMWSCLGLTDTESHNLRDMLNADILYRILKTRKLKRNLI